MKLKERDVFIKELYFYLKKYFIEIHLIFTDNIFNFQIEDMDIFLNEDIYEDLDIEIEKIQNKVYSFLKQFNNKELNNFPFNEIKQNLQNMLKNY